jgi:hypothetical protein
MPDDETLPAGGTDTATPVSTQAIEDKLGSFDFDHSDRRPPAGDAPATPKEPKQDELDPTDLAAADEVDGDGSKPEADEVETTKVRLRDGKEVAIAELKKAYRPEWEKETREFEDRRRKFEDESTQYQQRFQALTQQEQQLSRNLEAAVLILQNRLPKPPEKALFEQDPFEYQRQKMIYDDAQKEIADLAQKHNQLQQVGQQRSQEAFQEHAKKQNERLTAALPELKDPAKAVKFWEKVQSLGAAYGFTPQQMSQISDAGILLLANDAIKWREFTAQRAKLKEKEKDAKPMVPEAQAPARRVSTAEREAAKSREQLNRLRKTGRPADAEAFLSKFD